MQIPQGLRISCNQFTLCQLRRQLCSINQRNILIYLILLVVVVVEVLTYHLVTLSWHQLNCSWQSECTRILLVADPQLIGLQNEHRKLLTPLAIWDSDRYLSKTFSNAFHFTEPHVVLFLGDLFDEGSTSTDPEFRTYVRRFLSIFVRKPFNSVHHIFVPGDNDIGGEGWDKVTRHKLGRFEHAFQQPDIVQVKKVKFYKINVMTHTMAQFSERKDFGDVEGGGVTVGVSHWPLMARPQAFVDKVLEKLQPHVLFTAHTHTSMIVSTQHDFLSDRLITPVTPEDSRVYEYYLGVNEIYEILVPTCSYRMGTDKIGYGFAVIENGYLRYTVLWSPSRFPQLKLYGLMILICTIYVVYSRFCRLGRKDNKKTCAELKNVA